MGLKHLLIGTIQSRPMRNRGELPRVTVLFDSSRKYGYPKPKGLLDAEDKLILGR